MLIIAVISIFITLIVEVFIGRLFLFNPLSFKRDRITNNSYYSYKKPITVIIKTDDKLKELTKIDDSVRFIYNELKRSELIGPIYDIKIDKTYNLQYKGQLNIQSQKCQILTKIRWYGENADICSTTGGFGGEAFVKITTELKIFLNKLFNN